MAQIDVAVAVIHYNDQYLLGFRNEKQHQGNRYEFVGGKIEADEHPKQALIREVNEEIGLDISQDSTINRLGVLRHVYHDVSKQKAPKTVCLHVYRVALSDAQYEAFVHREQGCEGQSLRWANEADLLANQYPLPEANTTILEWLRMPDTIAISFDVPEVSRLNGVRGLHDDMTADLADNSSLIEYWVEFYSNRLNRNACFYARFKQSALNEQASAVQQLLMLREDVKLIVSVELAQALAQSRQSNEQLNQQQLPAQIVAQHLTQSALDKLIHENTMVDEYSDDALQVNIAVINELASLPLTISCHDEVGIHKANTLAQYLLNNNLPAVVGLYLSPVKATQTHPEKSALGWNAFQKLAANSEAPVIALGGMLPSELDQVRQYGGDKVAGIRQFVTEAS